MPKQPTEHIFTISELARTVRGLLETHFTSIWVEGEISNFVCPKSGHWYFSLKDNNAQIRCAMFRSTNQKLNFKIEDGIKILARAKVSLYEGRGDFQLIINYCEKSGLGALQREFEKLKNKLEQEGLFLAKHKKSIPIFPNCLGIITSPTGAAIRDVLHVLNRRFPSLPIILYPTLVQGDQAAQQIVQVIKTANQRNECDVLLLTRGGGSLEDLWPFNEACVARAIFNSNIPIVSGIGHEIDFTIADFVSDKRAPTPSAAAELISPNQIDILEKLAKLKQQLIRNLKLNFDTQKTQLKFLHRHLLQCHPQNKIEQQIQRCDYLEKTLINAQKQNLKKWKHLFQMLINKLNAMNPLKTLDRGFAMVTNQTNEVITNEKQVKSGEEITTQLAKGKIKSIII